MAKLSRPRYGTLQFYPRKRISKFLPRVNWDPVSSKEEGLLGFIVYKAGMATAVVKDNTDKSMTNGKEVSLPVTILEAPSMKLFSVRFYKHGKVVKETVVANDKELKHLVKVPKQNKALEVPADFDDVQVIVFSMPKQTSVKKTPDMIELGIKSDNKLEFVKSLMNREITLSDFLKFSLLDVRGLTTGKGLVGPVKRFGISLKAHKSEKGVRRPGSLAPWHPARVTFRTPMAGQLGLFTRITYNLNVLSSGKILDKDINPSKGFPHYGKVRSSYVIVKGSVQGPAKRQLLITPAYRPSKEQAKKKYEFMEVYA